MSSSRRCNICITDVSLFTDIGEIQFELVKYNRKVYWLEVVVAAEPSLRGRKPMADLKFVNLLPTENGNKPKRA